MRANDKVVRDLLRLAAFCGLGGGVVFVVTEYYLQAEAGNPSWYPKALWAACLLGGLGAVAFAWHLSTGFRQGTISESTSGRWVWLPVTAGILVSGSQGKLGIGLAGLALAIVGAGGSTVASLDLVWRARRAKF